MKNKKIILFSLFVLCFSLLFGISATPQKIEVSVFTIQQKEYPSADNKIYKWIEKKFGVTFKWDMLTGDLDQKIGVLIASGDLPDLVEVNNYSFENAGCLRPLEGYIEKYCPNLKKHYASCWNQMKSNDGHIYVLPNLGVYEGSYTYPAYNQNAFWIHKDVLKEFGYPTIKTLDEYVDLIERYYSTHSKINGNKTIPFSLLVADWENFNYYNPGIFLAGYPNDGACYVLNKNGEYVTKSIYSADFTKKWVEKLNDIYRRGILDDELFSINERDIMLERIIQERVLGFYAQGWEFMYNSPTCKNYVPLPLTFDTSITPKYKDIPLPNLYRGYGITTKCKEKKAIQILKFMDAMMEEENQKVLYWGFKDEDYKLDKNGVPYRTKEQKERSENYEWKLKNKAELWMENAPKWEGCFSDGNPENLIYLRDEYYEQLTPGELEVVKAYDITGYGDLMGEAPKENPFWYPMWQLIVDFDINSLPTKYCAKSSELVVKYFKQLIVCDKFDFNRIWNEYTKELKEAGEEEFEKACQKAFEERKKNRN